MENPNPVIYDRAPRAAFSSDGVNNAQVTTERIFELIRDINDPEYPNTLEQLAVVSKEQVQINEASRSVRVDFTPTIPHCSMATLIGLSIRVKLMRSLPPAYDIDVYIREGTHVAEDAINKQLNDKERVAAALENPHLLSVLEQCLCGVPKPGIALNMI